MAEEVGYNTYLSNFKLHWRLPHMMLYQTPHFQVHMLPIDGYEAQYQVLSVMTGLVELKTSVLTNALYQADTSTKTLDKFLGEAVGGFNPQLGGKELEYEDSDGSEEVVIEDAVVEDIVK